MSNDEGVESKTTNPEKAALENESRFLEEMFSESVAAEEAARDRHKTLYTILKPFFSPKLLGKENIPSKPVLLVGNHALFELDVPLIQSTFLHESGRLVRAMGDRVLFSNATMRNMMVNQAGILGHPEVCGKMMGLGKDLMVFPGGSHEVNKPVDQRYQLKWKERYGFVKLAALHGYTILPFATIGPDEFYGRYMESDELYSSALGKLLIKYGVLSEGGRTDILPPVPKGMFGTSIPKPQRFYMSVGKPIDLENLKGQTLEKDKLAEIRLEVSSSIESQIRDLLLIRTQHSESDGWLRRFLTR